MRFDFTPNQVETLRLAICEAISWNDGLIDAHTCQYTKQPMEGNAAHVKEFEKQNKRYRKLLEKIDGKEKRDEKETSEKED